MTLPVMRLLAALVSALVLLATSAAPAVADADEPVVTSPQDGAQVAPGAITITGSASADDVVTRVDLSVFRTDDSTYLRPDGSFAPGWQLLLPELASEDAPSTDWSYDATLEPGRYRIGVKARDGASAPGPNTTITVDVQDDDEPGADTTPPTVEVAAPALEADTRNEVTAGPLTVVTRLADDVAVRELRYAVRDQDTAQWLRADGSFGDDWAQLDAALVGEGAEVDAQVDLDLAPGRYLLALYAFDTSGNRTRADRVLDAVDAAPDLPAVAHGGLVPDDARTDTVRVLDGEVLALDQAGDTVVVGGDFDTIRLADGTDVAQADLTAYDVASGDELSGFRPQLDGAVEDVEGLPDGSFVVGGRFTSVDGEPRRKIARFAADGTLDPDFSPSLAGNVTSVQYAAGRLFVAGSFRFADGKRRELVTMLDATTGEVLDGLSTTFAEGISVGGYCNANAALPNRAGTSVLVVHSCRLVEGEVRTIAARFDEVGGTFRLSDWALPVYEDNRAAVGGQIPVRKAAVSPDFSYGVIVARGGDKPPIGDTVVAFPLTGEVPVEPRWITRTHDSLYSVTVTEELVYAGGHFQYLEGPQAPDPWPGDTDVNYGFGQGGGARVLGGQALRRQQVAALDPATGHAMPWNPGANGQRAVLELAATPAGLLLGHDGTTIAGRDIGRHGVFDLSRAPEVPEAPSTVVASPQPGLTTTAGPVHVDGRATPAGDVTRVEVEAVAADGRSIAVQDAELAGDVVVGERAWQLTIPFDAGDWTVRTRAWVGDTAGPWAERTLRVIGSIGDEPPEVELTAPDTQALPPGATTFEGTASDDVGVASVDLVVQDLDSREYLTPDGSRTTTFTTLPATLTNPDAITTRWSVDVDLPEGEWRVQPRPTDTTGKRQSNPPQRNYVVSSTAVPPELEVTVSPDQDARTTDRTPTFEVSASDDREVKAIQVQASSFIPTNRFWDVSTGTIAPGNAQWFPVPGAVVGQGTTDASAEVTLPELPYGRWQVRFVAVDDQGLLSSEQQVRFYVVVEGDEPPSADLTSIEVNQSDFTERTIPIAGTASDDVAVESLTMSVRGQGIGANGANQWLQPDGSFAEDKAEVEVELVTGQGTPEATFDTSVDVPVDGAYNVFVYPRDSAGQPNSLLRWNRETVQVFVVPGDEAPQVVLDAPSEGQQLTGTTISLNGSATDDQQLARVQVRVVNRDTQQGPRRDGSIGNPQWVDVSAFNNPGQDRTQWAHVTPEVEPGPYNVRARVIDDRSQVSEIVRRNVELVAP